MIFQAHKENVILFTESLLLELAKLDLSIANTNLIPIAQNCILCPQR
jgi:hypothetical protein